MKISHVRITPVAFRDPPILNVVGVHEPYASRCIVEVETDRGLIGLGETYGDRTTAAALARIGPELAGVDVFDLPSVLRIVRGHAELGRHSEFEMAPGTLSRTAVARYFSAFEVALLDAQGQHLGCPVYDLLGGRFRDAVPYAGYLFFKFGSEFAGRDPAHDGWGEVLTPHALVGEAEMFVHKFGFRSLKLKGGVLEPEAEIETMRLLQQRFPGYPLRIDPNYGWTVQTSLRVSHALEGVIDYLEDPTQGFAALAEVRRGARQPIASNMAVTDFNELRTCIEQGALDIILSDHHYWGGLRATRALAQVCATFGLKLAMHSNSHLGISLMAMTHVAASIEDMPYSCDTHYPWQSEDVIAGGSIRFHDGAVALNGTPGLGIQLDREKLAQMNAVYEEHVTGDRDDVAEMRRHVPDWVGKVPRF